MPTAKTLPATMRAIRLENGAYHWRELPMPARGEALVKVAYAGMNRADLFQTQGNYPQPKNGIPGLEFSGTIVKGGGRWREGDAVCGIVTEGAFAEYTVSPAATLMPVPRDVSLKEAAALPEAMLTAWISLFEQAKLKPGETLLIHGGASSVGLMAIQMGKRAGARVFATAGTKEKCALCKRMGAELAVNYKEQDFAKVLSSEGADVILDMVGGDYVQKNMALLKPYGRLCMIAFLRGAKIEVNLAPLLTKKLSLSGSVLRDRPVAEKARFARAVVRKYWPDVAAGRIRPVLDGVFSLKEAEKGIKRLESSLNSGKIVLEVLGAGF
jgi:putative PIG3 family NAD(P)H quinone oxidoreductase